MSKGSPSESNSSKLLAFMTIALREHEKEIDQLVSELDEAKNNLSANIGEINGKMEKIDSAIADLQKEVCKIREAVSKCGV